MHMYKQSKAKGKIRQGYLRLENTFVFTAIRIRIKGVYALQTRLSKHAVQLIAILN
jgi:hypothetical protein